NIVRPLTDLAARSLDVPGCPVTIVDGVIDQPVGGRISLLAGIGHHSGHHVVVGAGKMVLEPFHAAVDDLPAKNPAIEAAGSFKVAGTELVPARIAMIAHIFSSFLAFFSASIWLPSKPPNGTSFQG